MLLQKVQSQNHMRLYYVGVNVELKEVNEERILNTIHLSRRTGPLTN